MERTVSEIEAEIERIERRWEGQFAPPFVIAKLDRLQCDELPAAYRRERQKVAA